MNERLMILGGWKSLNELSAAGRGFDGGLQRWMRPKMERYRRHQNVTLLSRHTARTTTTIFLHTLHGSVMSHCFI